MRAASPRLCHPALDFAPRGAGLRASRRHPRSARPCVATDAAAGLFAAAADPAGERAQPCGGAAMGRRTVPGFKQSPAPASLARLRRRNQLLPTPGRSPDVGPEGRNAHSHPCLQLETDVGHRPRSTLGRPTQPAVLSTQTGQPQYQEPDRVSPRADARVARPPLPPALGRAPRAQEPTNRMGLGRVGLFFRSGRS